MINKRQVASRNKVKRVNTQQKGVWGMPMASGGEEGRGKRRNTVGTRWQGLIHWYPNGATHCLEETVPSDRGKRGELKHLSTRRKRKQASDSVSSGERKRTSPNQLRYGVAGVVGPDIKQPIEHE